MHLLQSCAILGSAVLGIRITMDHHSHSAQLTLRCGNLSMLIGRSRTTASGARCECRLMRSRDFAVVRSQGRQPLLFPVFFPTARREALPSAWKALFRHVSGLLRRLAQARTCVTTG